MTSLMFRKEMYWEATKPRVLMPPCKWLRFPSEVALCLSQAQPLFLSTMGSRHHGAFTPPVCCSSKGSRHPRVGQCHHSNRCWGAVHVHWLHHSRATAWERPQGTWEEWASRPCQLEVLTCALLGDGESNAMFWQWIRGATFLSGDSWNAWNIQLPNSSSSRPTMSSLQHFRIFVETDRVASLVNKGKRSTSEVAFTKSESCMEDMKSKTHVHLGGVLFHLWPPHFSPEGSDTLLPDAFLISRHPNKLHAGTRLLWPERPACHGQRSWFGNTSPPGVTSTDNSQRTRAARYLEAAVVTQQCNTVYIKCKVHRTASALTWPAPE